MHAAIYMFKSEKAYSYHVSPHPPHMTLNPQSQNKDDNEIKDDSNQN